LATLTHGDGSAGAAMLEQRRRELDRILRSIGPMVIGFSGGADSTLLLKTAVDALGEGALAVTTVSASLPERERREAIELAREIGARHLLVESDEFDDPSYRANGERRCFFCKKELFEILWRTARETGRAAVAYGAITDDLGDFRPGMDAAREAGARAPLLEAGLSKDDVRALSRRLGLRTWDRPATACLSSRVPHGTPIDAAVLGRVELAEDWLLEHGFRQVRVRAHGEIARIECSPDDLPRFVEPELRRRLAERFREIGFRYVTLDLEGYRTGSLSPLLTLERR